MLKLEMLTQQATLLAEGSAEDEGVRIMQICNACRYCEGFCAVFPAMTRRAEFNISDIHYLSNLCHNCGACLYACQYAPPHEFSVNVPQTFARIRKETYIAFSWPKSFGILYKNNGIFVSLAVSIAVILFLLFSFSRNGALKNLPVNGDFYSLISHNSMAITFGFFFGFSIIALGVGVTQFWRNISVKEISIPAWGEAINDTLTMKYLGGGHGDGCNNADDSYSLLRKYFHHLTFYGFMLCFFSTAIATMYHYLLDLHAPYGYASLPVIFGFLGGVGLLIGPIGLLYLNYLRNPEQVDGTQIPMDRAFIVLLFLISFSGLALLFFRTSTYMSVLMAIHLGIVMGFFLTMPYSKFAHGVYRLAALLKNAIEKRQKNAVQFGSD